jgi:hypothetical protein
MKISGILSIKDGIYRGYPFLEAILSVLPICDEFLINEAKSEDETLYYLKKLKKVFPKIKIYQIPWYESDYWEALDETINFLIYKSKGDWIFEVQGDEIWHEKDILKIKKIIEEANEKGFNSIRQPRLDCSWTHIDSYIYKTVRIVKKISGLKSYWGGDDFHIGNCGPPKEGYTSHNVPPELEIDIPFYHLHRVFPQNVILQDEGCVFIARKNLERIEVLERHKKVDWQRIPPPKISEVLDCLPAIIKGLSQETKYKVRKEIFDKKWLRKITGLNY